MKPPGKQRMDKKKAKKRLRLQRERMEAEEAEEAARRRLQDARDAADAAKAKALEEKEKEEEEEDVEDVEEDEEGEEGRKRGREEEDVVLACPRPGCTFETTAEATLAAHLRLEHTPLGQFPCAHCGQRFKGRPALDTHVKKKHKKGGGRLPCPHAGCKFSMKNDVQLQFHIDRFHR